jgi:ABC-type antimicrobial peptide transport system permease subunit
VNSTRFFAYGGEMLLGYKDKIFKENMQMTDPALFEIFTFPIIKGDIKNVFPDAHSIVLTEKTARKYFGDEDPMGKIIKVQNKFDFKVTAVLKDVPINSDIRFTVLTPVEFMKELAGFNYENWGTNCIFTYIILKNGTQIADVNKKIIGRLKKESNSAGTGELFLHPLSKLRLYSISGSGGGIVYVRIFSTVALFVLLIACINFMNLSTARSVNRSKEIGLRKVIGAMRSQLIKQFYGESLLLSFIALMVSILIVELLLPFFNNLTGKQISLNYLDFQIMGGLIAIAVFTGIVSGSYPSLMLSAFKPITALGGILRRGSKGALFRKILVVFQFSLSIILIICTTIVANQLFYLQKKDLGLNKENIVYISLNDQLKKEYKSFKNELLQNKDVLSVTQSSSLPTGVYQNGGGWSWEGKDPNTDVLVTNLFVDLDFLETFKIPLDQGRFYLKEYGADSLSIIVNEAFVKKMGTKSPVGKQISNWGMNFSIIGIVKDFHFTPVSNEIGPIVMVYYPPLCNYIVAKVSSSQITNTIDYLEKTFKKYNPGDPFEYHFLDEDYDNLYKSELRLSKIFGYFSILTIIISCLGLFGLASFTLQQRTKEIGVRKVLGATISGLIFLLSKEFMKWVLIANIIAWPVAYYFMDKWLQDYAYKIDLNLLVFLFSAGLAFALALLTVGIQAVKASRANPADSLKYE